MWEYKKVLKVISVRLLQSQAIFFYWCFISCTKIQSTNINKTSSIFLTHFVHFVFCTQELLMLTLPCDTENCNLSGLSCLYQLWINYQFCTVVTLNACIHNRWWMTLRIDGEWPYACLVHISTRMKTTTFSPKFSTHTYGNMFSKFRFGYLNCDMLIYHVHVLKTRVPVAHDSVPGKP